MASFAVIFGPSTGPARAAVVREALRRAAGPHTLVDEGPADHSIAVDDAVADGARRLTSAEILRDPAAALSLEDAPRLVGVTACPTGIAHTFMAAEGLEGAARALGYPLKVETQGSVGARNTLTADDIAAADVVIVAAETNVDLARFAGKRVYRTTTKPAIQDGAAVIRTALAEARVHGTTTTTTTTAATTARPGGLYQHLMTGVSHMLPFVVAGGLILAIAFAVGSWQLGAEGIYVGEERFAGTLGHELFRIGSQGAFGLFVPALAGFIAFSIADRPGLAPGMVGGLLAMDAGAGFFGGIVAGFLAGYVVRGLDRAISLPRSLAGLKPTLLLPLLGTLAVGLLMIYVVGEPVAAAMGALTAALTGLGGASAGLLGALTGGMMAVDLGGPVNKAAYTFGTGLVGSQVYGPMAAAMAGGMTPPLSVALATLLFRSRFTPEERDAGKVAAVLGAAFVTEGAIPFAARSPGRVIPALVAGSAVAGAISMAAGVELRTPHGGVFVLVIPNAVNHVAVYAGALAAGTLVSALLLGLLLKPAPEAAKPTEDISGR